MGQLDQADDAICDDLLNNHGVTIWDKDEGWLTILREVEEDVVVAVALPTTQVFWVEWS
jgi:hypothetical protein